METSPIIAQLDVAGNVIYGLLACRVNCPVHQLNLDRAIDRFSERVIIALTGQYIWSDPLAG